MPKIVSGLLAGVVTLTLAACGPSGSGETQTAQAEAGPVRVLTTFYPTTYFAQRIAGDLAEDGSGQGVEISCPVPADADPIFWQPTAEQVGAYQEADLIVLNGAGYEKWAKNAALPHSRVVDTASGFAGEFIMIEGKTHSHGTAGAHTHEGLDGHTWLDPVNAIAQARKISDAMAGLAPERGEDFLSNLEALEADLQGLDARLQEISATRGNTRVLSSHPAYNYVSRRYGWGVTSFDLDPGEAITAEQLAAVEAAKNPDSGERTIMLWESEPIAENVAALDGLGIESVVFSPVETVDAETLAAGEDYLSLMNANLDRLAAAFKP